MVSCDPAGLPVYSWFCQGNRENKIICNLLQNSCFIFASIDYKVRWSFTGKSYWLAKGKFRALAFLAMLSNSLAVKGIAKNKAIPYKGYNFLTEEQTWDADTARQLCRAHRAGAASWSLPFLHHSRSPQRVFSNTRHRCFSPQFYTSTPVTLMLIIHILRKINA